MQTEKFLRIMEESHCDTTISSQSSNIFRGNHFWLSLAVIFIFSIIHYHNLFCQVISSSLDIFQSCLQIGMLIINAINHFTLMPRISPTQQRQGCSFSLQFYECYLKVLSYPQLSNE